MALDVSHVRVSRTSAATSEARHDGATVVGYRFVGDADETSQNGQVRIVA